MPAWSRARHSTPAACRICWRRGVRSSSNGPTGRRNSNACAERRLSLLLTAEGAPARWGTRLPDLSSRLKALPVATIGAPDDRLIHAILIKLFADRQLIIADDVVAFLTARMERSFEAASRLVAAIDTAALAAQRRVSVPLARDVLRSLYPDEN
jgi:chromosomal replication initiation ATPase DnaA